MINAPSLKFKSYQLFVNVYKGESFPLMEDGNPASAFVSVRTQQSILTTRTFPQNASPNFYARLYFPVFLPTFNDKIRLVLWHNDGKDVFLANVPELANSTDFANISTLVSLDGKM